MRGSIMWTCEYRECNNTFKRYNVYVERGHKKYCCQSHAALEQHALNTVNNEKQKQQYKEKKYTCVFCGKEIVAYTSPRKYCINCKEIIIRINRLKIKNPNLQVFTPIDYYEILKLQNNKCNICKVDKCSTGKNFCIDHNHDTGKVRGLLCYSCNTKLGWYEKNKISIEKYITR